MNFKFNYTLLATMLFLFACQDEPKEQKVPAIVKEKAPVEWLSMEGEESIKKNKKVVLVSGDEEYRSEEALPQLARILSKDHGFDCTVLFAQDPAKPGVVNPNYTKNIPGLESLDDADLMIIFTRFRVLPDAQMQHFKSYLEAGKPVIGIRTATHAFVFGDKDTLSSFHNWGNYSPDKDGEWAGGFGQKILGVKWHTHHGHHKHQSTRGIFANADVLNPILNGITDGSIWGPTDVYGAPLPENAVPIVMGQVVDRMGEFDKEDLYFGMKPTDRKIATVNPANKNKSNPNEPMMPIVWTKPYKMGNGVVGTSITSTIGASSDLMNEELRRLFVNSTYYLLGQSVPEKAKVDLVGEYNPTQFSFRTNEYWELKGMRVSDF